MSKEKKETQMSLWEDSLANQCQSQEKEKEQMTTAISGQKCLDSLGRSNPNSLLGRMCKELLTSKTAWYSDRCKTTWKVKVSKSNVSLFQLQASVLGTKDTESGLWATPNTMDYLLQDRKKNQTEHQTKGRTQDMRSSENKLYPTPTENKRDKENNQHMVRQRCIQHQQDLSIGEKMYPTPSTQAVEFKIQRCNVSNTEIIKPNPETFIKKEGNHVQMTI